MKMKPQLNKSTFASAMCLFLMTLHSQGLAPTRCLLGQQQQYSLMDAGGAAADVSIVERLSTHFLPRHDRPDESDDEPPNHWELRLYDDETNFEYWVAEQLVKIALLTELEAYKITKTADATGQATIATYDNIEVAEHYHQALHAEGLSVKLHPIPVLT